MVNELKQLLRENVAAPPPDHLDLDGLVSRGRSRVRRRRTAAAGGVAALAVVGALTAAAVGLPGVGGDHAEGPVSRPTPDAPTISLADATPAVAGRDFRELASHTNDNLNRDNGQYFDGLTDDGLVLFRDGPRMDQLRPRFALLDPGTGAKDWLPDLRIGQMQTWPVGLGSDRLVLAGAAGGDAATLVLHVFDREARTWSEHRWPALPSVDFAGAARMGPDGRIYVATPATQGKVPAGGWPTQPGGDAEDADAEGDTNELWSVGLDGPSDLRDEGMRVGDFAFTASSLVWTDRTNGDPGSVHVRDLASGEEHSFDPHAGERCNLLSFGATADRVVMGEYCGTYDGGVRDDRVQVLTTDGDQVVTLQDSGIDGGLAGPGRSSELVTVTSYAGKRAGTYLYDLGSDRLLRVTDAVSQFALGASALDDRFFWSTPVNGRKGAQLHLGELLP